MYKKKKIIRSGLFAMFCSSIFLAANAQFSMSGQFRLRTEFRDGQGAPLPEGTNPAFFISQRTRLNIGYQMYRLKLGFSIQDIRVWGQDVSTINRTTIANNNGLMLYEAWAEILLTDTSLKNKSLSLKIGRQELVYDDQRLIGNLDWLQQGRRFDAAVLKYESGLWKIHLAGAYNQNQENSSGTIYNPTPPGNYTASTNGGTMYKSLEFLYAGKKLNTGNISFLFFSDQFSKYNSDTLDNVISKTYQSSTWSRETTGFYLNNTFHKIGITASAYYQFGKSSSGQSLSAGLLSGFVQFLFNEKTSAGGGIDFTSGGTTGSTSNNFDPLYGTPHKFWGFMDYYYAASPFGKGGLTDYYVKFKRILSDKSLLTIDFHQFSSAAKVLVSSIPVNNKSFGQELDFVYSYNLTKEISFEAGYGHYWSTALLTSANVKNVPNTNSNSNWAYIMINIHPDFLFKK
ncbi:MAG TPA: alginate export family protein [Puia sp.]|jgi:hypothetical protein|nr:alginate export family protein [Puia sp.]